MTSARQLRAWIRLSLCRLGVAETWNRWLVELEAADLALEDFLELPEHQARPFLRNWPTVARALRREVPSSDRLDRIAEQLAREKIHLIPINDPRYPARLLADLGFDAPTFLYAVGRLGHLRSPTVALAGTREPSPNGLETARAYAGGLARQDIHVVSGHARGIDVAAHEGALAAGGATTLVLPCGIFAFQLAPPLRHLTTPANTLVLSQFSPEASRGPDLPIRRNATIAALADGLIVVESGLIGGTSHVFREARRLRKPVWTVIYPEPVPPSAAGNHSLLSAGAEPLEPGEAGAERCAATLAQRLHAAHAERPRSATWPPRESPGQEDLF